MDMSTPEALATMRLVNHGWRNAVDGHVTSFRPKKRVIEPMLSQLLSRFKNLKDINSPDPNDARLLLQVSDQTLPTLKGLTRLQSLAMGLLVTADGFNTHAVSISRSLTSLSYHGGGSVRNRRDTRSTVQRNVVHGLDDKSAAVIGGTLTGLNDLAISRCAEIGVGLTALSALTNLRALQLYELEKLDNATFFAVASPLTGLTALTVSMCELITDEAAPTLKCLTSLERLDFSHNGRLSDVSDILIDSLGPLTRLQSLMLSSCQATLRTLPSLPQLLHLEVAETEVDDEGLQSLSRVPLLQRLSIADCQQATCKGLGSLRLLPCLESLNMRSCQGIIATEEDLHPMSTIGHLTRLTSLKADYLPFDEMGDFLVDLAPLTSLRVLTLDDFYGPLTDRALDALCGLRNLQQLKMRSLKLEPSSLQRLQEVLVNLEPAGLQLDAENDILQWVQAMNANAVDDEDEGPYLMFAP